MLTSKKPKCLKMRLYLIRIQFWGYRFKGLIWYLFRRKERSLNLVPTLIFSRLMGLKSSSKETILRMPCLSVIWQPKRKNLNLRIKTNIQRVKKEVKKMTRKAWNNMMTSMTRSQEVFHWQRSLILWQRVVWWHLSSLMREFIVSGVSGPQFSITVGLASKFVQFCGCSQ